MPDRKVNPAADDTANGARNALLDCKRADHNTRANDGKLVLAARIPPSGVPFTVNGRSAQTLHLLNTTGPQGFTSGEASSLAWARRTSAYVHKLRRLGVPIATTREATSDGAMVARYCLAGPVVLIAQDANTE